MLRVAAALIERMRKRLIRVRARRTPWGIAALFGLAVATLALVVIFARPSPLPPTTPMPLPDVAAPPNQPPLPEPLEPEEPRGNEQQPEQGTILSGVTLSGVTIN